MSDCDHALSPVTVKTMEFRKPFRIDSVLDAIADGVLILDARTAKIVYANRRTEGLYGYDADDIIHMTWGELSANSPPYIPEEANDRIIAAAKGTPQVFQWLAGTKTGRAFWAQVCVSAPPGDGANHVVVTVRDISDRKRVEDELTATKDYLDTVYNSIHDAVFVHDIDGKVTDVNNAMLEMYRCTRREALGLYIHPDYTTADGLPDLKAIWKSVMKGNDEFLECRGRRPKDGLEFDVEVFLTRLRLPTGDSILATVRNISERKKVERELRATKNYLNTVFNSIHDAVFVHDIDGRVVDVNDKLLDMYKLTREEAIGLHISPDYTTPKGSPDFRKIWESVMKGHDTVIECRGRRPNDGHEFDAETFLTKLSLPGGDYILANTHDVSARKTMEKQLQAERRRFKTVSESSPVGMVVIDGERQYKFNYLNPKFKELFGCDSKETPDIYAWLSRVYPDAAIRREAIPKWIGALQATGRGNDRLFVRKLTGRGGLQKYVRFVQVPLDTGEILMTCWDITETREAERRIRERNLVLEVLNEVMSSVTGSLNLADIKRSLERVLARKLQISAGGIFFEGTADISAEDIVYWGVPDSKRDEFVALAMEVYRTGTVIYENEIRLTRCCPDKGGSRTMPGSKNFKWPSYLCISLSSKAQNPGMVFLAEKKPDAFGDDQIPFYATLGQQIGVAIQNARLFEQVRQSHEQMKNLSLRLVRVQEEELRHVGRELHDEVGQLLTGLGLTLEMALQSKASLKASLSKAKSLADTITDLVRELSGRLRPSMLDDLGLSSTLPWLFERFSSLTNVTVGFERMTGKRKRFGHEVETAVYRIVQEGLTNIARHARTDQATVRLWAKESTLGVQVEDYGSGFDIQSVLKARNVNGLNGIRERVTLLGGRFTVDTRPGGGTRLTAEFPLKKNGAKR